MLPEAGRAKISARVFKLLRFMRKKYHKAVSGETTQAGSRKPKMNGNSRQPSKYLIFVYFGTRGRAA
jgi:hypothetical protein